MESEQTAIGVCVNIVAGLNSELGGIAASTPYLCRAIDEAGCFRAPVISIAGKSKENKMQGSNIGLFPAGHWRWITKKQLRLALCAEIEKSELAHIHGLWQEHCLWAGRFCRKLGKPYIVSAHGMLEHWALANKRWKKAIYSAVIEQSNLRRATCLRALSKEEVDDYREWGLKNPVAVIPNGVTIPQRIDPEAFWQRWPELRDRRLVLFLGRIHYKKGVELLARAWGAIERDYPDTQLVFAGPDSEATLRQLQGRITALGITDRVTFTGMLNETLKWSALTAATVFVLPSYSEGFSIAVLEALGAGCPVIISRQCRFSEMERSDCGWVIEPEVAELAGLLVKVLALPKRELERMGAAGSALVRRFYTWPSIGLQMSELYSWVLGGSRPRSVEIYE